MTCQDLVRSGRRIKCECGSQLRLVVAGPTHYITCRDERCKHHDSLDRYNITPVPDWVVIQVD